MIGVAVSVLFVCVSGLLAFRWHLADKASTRVSVSAESMAVKFAEIEKAMDQVNGRINRIETARLGRAG